MRILKSWVLDYLHDDISDKDLIDKITFSGTEVEGVFGELDKNVIVVEIRSIDKHPNADRLNKVMVYDGKNDIQIVCGAVNIEVGQKVPLAKPGAILGDITIAEATIRGIASQGMLCSKSELGIGDDHTGINILPSDVPLGAKLSDVLKNDVILDIKPTPNRGDCFCHLGLAREVAAILSGKIKMDKIKIGKVSSASLPEVEVLAKEFCPQYGARIIKGVIIGPSPKKIADRLIACGMKPINNIVDITNYIMLDMGQPMHAFDAEKIKDNKIIVRKARQGETIVCLDGTKRNLTGDNLVIADFEKPIAIAGVIGGLDSQITEETHDIIFEAAEFDRRSVRKTSKDLTIVTDASYRFERGIDSAGIERALNKATMMVLDDCGVDEVGQCVIVKEPFNDNEIEINHHGINELLGKEFSKDDINTILVSLGFEVRGDKCVAPSYRHDIVDFRCLTEEVGRIYGYDNLPDIELDKPDILPKRADYHKKEYIKDRLVDLGFSEVYNYSFMSENDQKAADIPGKDLLEVTNPVQPENKYMRNSLIPGLLKSVAKNPTFDPVQLFEVGNVFGRESEVSMLAVVASGKEAKKCIDAAIEKIAAISGLNKSDIKLDEISREETEIFKIKKPVTYLFEIEVKKVIDSMKIDNDQLELIINQNAIRYRPVSKYPSLTRDLAFIVDTSIVSDNIIDQIYKVSDLINRVELFDEFTSDKFGVNKKNVAFHLYLQSPDRTLDDKEADQIIAEVIRKIEDKFKVALRS